MSKNRVNVVIGGSILALQSTDSEEHMQRVAKVINGKLDEIHSVYDRNHIGHSKTNTLLTLNLADECVKKQEIINEYTRSLEQVTIENKQLKESIAEIKLQLADMKKQLELTTHQGRKEHVNRGR